MSCCWWSQFPGAEGNSWNQYCQLANLVSGSCCGPNLAEIWGAPGDWKLWPIFSYMDTCWQRVQLLNLLGEGWWWLLVSPEAYLDGGPPVRSCGWKAKSIVNGICTAADTQSLHSWRSWETWNEGLWYRETIDQITLWVGMEHCFGGQCSEGV